MKTRAAALTAIACFLATPASAGELLQEYYDETAVVCAEDDGAMDPAAIDFLQSSFGELAKFFGDAPGGPMLEDGTRSAVFDTARQNAVRERIDNIRYYTNLMFPPLIRSQRIGDGELEIVAIEVATDGEQSPHAPLRFGFFDSLVEADLALANENQLAALGPWLFAYMLAVRDVHQIVPLAGEASSETMESEQLVAALETLEARFDELEPRVNAAMARDEFPPLLEKMVWNRCRYSR